VATEYRYRRYQDGDATAINSLYEEITGRRRTIPQFEWQWLQAPGGRGEIWLIEAFDDSGKSELIGHHGIMPVRFTDGNDDLLFGKTENTMVLPEYRSRILYPRFEKRFANEYEPRFDALFSTGGPPEAIRQRRAQGYRFSAKWVRVQIPTSRLGAIRLLYKALLGKMGGAGASREVADDGPEPSIEIGRTGSPWWLRALRDHEARKEPFFDSFWPNCRAGYGLTPRRDKGDLDWRFWSNPYSRHITLISDTDPQSRGYAIIRRSKTQPAAATIEDIAPYEQSAASFSRLLDSVISWTRQNGISWIDFATTDDPGVTAEFVGELNKRSIDALSLVSHLRKREVATMPRKITPSGDSREVRQSGWYVTPLIFEGRSN